MENVFLIDSSMGNAKNHRVDFQLWKTYLHYNFQTVSIVSDKKDISSNFYANIIGRSRWTDWVLTYGF